MPSVSVNPPKTPVTKGSNGTAAATIPNVCKMPGPPAPFVPAPLPNIGKSGDSPQGYSQDVTIEGKAVAIKGATFNSMGDMASKGTGGGLISANTHGITKFVGPGSMDVKIEGKNVQLLSDPMLNNCGPGGSPPNSATLVGVIQGPGLAYVLGDEPCPLCGKQHGDDVKVEDAQVPAGVPGEVKSAITAALAHANSPAELAARRPRFEARIAELRGGLSAVKSKAKDKLKSRIRQTEKERDRAELSTMVGAVKCKCGKIYAGTSLTQYSDVVDKYAHHAPTPTHTIGEPPDKVVWEANNFQRFQSAVSDRHKAAFKDVWEVHRTKSEERAGGAEDTFYPPGYCAGQIMLLLALEHNTRPIGLKEEWFSSKGSNLDSVPLRVRDGAADKVGRLATPAEKGGTASVPPCGTCNVILQALLCPDDKSLDCAFAAAPDQCCRC